MTHPAQKDCVKYECTCGTSSSIVNLYFCRHCLKLRCSYCICHEVDLHYCSNCLEHLPATEAKLKKNRCASCFDCPNCSQTLSVRATTRNVEDGSAKGPTKYFYLSCFFCRWTTRDVGIPDQSSATANWPVVENPYTDMLASYLEYYRIVAMRERSQKEKKTLTFRRGYTSFTEKFGLTSMIARKRAGLPSLPLAVKDLNPGSLPVITPCEAVGDVDPLPETYFTEAPDLTKITTIAQRHANPLLQPETTKDFRMQHRHFFIKRSLRCRQCEHNVSKPEFHPGSIKFKIQLSAYYHMPDVRIVTAEPLRAGQTSEIILKISNPTQHMTSLQFMDKEKEQTLKEVMAEAIQDKKEPTITIPKPPTSFTPNCKVILPNASVLLPPKDDAAEFYDGGEMQNTTFQDDPKVTVWRKGNKAAIRFHITPSDKLKPGDQVHFAFTLEYGYVNTLPTLESKQPPQRTEMQVNVFLSPGTILGVPEDAQI